MGILKKGDRVQVKIEKLIYGGAGLARLDGQVLFVDYAVPEDELEVEIIEAKKNFGRAQIHQILKPGPARVTPKCPVFGSCGGCQWQQVDYSQQIEAKQSILSEVLKRFLPGESVELGDFVPSPRPWNYRNRIQVKSVAGKIGFYAKNSHTLIPIRDCAIAEPAVNQALVQLSQAPRGEGQFRIQIGLDGRVSTQNIDGDDEPLGFAQVNQLQNDFLQKQIHRHYSSYVGNPIIDLYGGYGNLSLALAQHYPQIRVEVVEWNRKAVAEGIGLAKKNETKSIRFINSDVEAYLQRVSLPTNSFVIMDPPREGCSKAVLQELASKSPKVLLYVSCDPMTWGRDIQFFLTEVRNRGGNYRIATIHGLDMFPQTDHIEVLSLFERIDELEVRN